MNWQPTLNRVKCDHTIVFWLLKWSLLKRRKKNAIYLLTYLERCFINLYVWFIYLYSMKRKLLFFIHFQIFFSLVSLIVDAIGRMRIILVGGKDLKQFHESRPIHNRLHEFTEYFLSLGPFAVKRANNQNRQDRRINVRWNSYAHTVTLLKSHSTHCQKKVGNSSSSFLLILSKHVIWKTIGIYKKIYFNAIFTRKKINSLTIHMLRLW